MANSRARLPFAAIAVLSLLAAQPALAQPTPLAPPLEGVFRELVELQDANLGIARQMAELEKRAAAELQSALDSGRFARPVHQQLARTFVGNALTLASMILSPIQTRDAAAGATMILLIQRNIGMLRSVASVVAQDPELAAALGRYTVLQMQTEDLASALQNGWNRYGRILLEAQSGGLLSADAFDPARQSWSLATPVTDPAAVAALAPPAKAPGAPMTALPEAATSLAANPPQPATTPTATAIAETPAAEPNLPPTTTTTSTTVTTTTETASVTPPEPATRVPVPALSGTPHPAGDGAVEPGTPVTPPPGATTSTSSTTTTTTEVATAPSDDDAKDRLSPGGPLDIVPVRQAPGSGPMLLGDWLFEVDADGRPLATASNLNTQTADIIRTMAIGCAPDGSLVYDIDGAKQFTGFRVYADQLSYRAVTTRANTVEGPDAATMSETLALGYEWAQKVPDAGRRLTLRADDASGTLALFSAAGYVEARDRVVASCAAGPGPTVASAPDAAGEDPANAAPAGTATTPPATAAASESPKPAAVAPVPAPRIVRPPRAAPLAPAQATPPSQQPSSGPINLLSGG